jgi:hypothetical protein
VNRHEVIGLSAGFRESLGQKVVKSAQPFDSPILSGPNLTQIFPELDKPHVSLLLLGLFPGQDLIDPPEDEHSPAMVEFR